MTTKTDEPRNRCAECARCHLLKKCIGQATTVKNPQFWIHQQFNLFYTIAIDMHMRITPEKDELYFATRKIISALHVLDRNNPAPIAHIDLDMRQAEHSECKTCPDHNTRIVAGYFYGLGYDYLVDLFDFASKRLRFFTEFDPQSCVDVVEFIEFSKTFFGKIEQIIKLPDCRISSFDNEI